MIQSSQQSASDISSFKTLLRIYVAVTVGNILIFSLLYILFPQLRDTLPAEDKLIENLSAIFFLLTFLYGIFIIIRTEKIPKIYFFMPLIGLAGFLDEVSFGDRIFHFNLPVIQSEKVDQFHDIITIGHELFLQKHVNFLFYVFFVTGFIVLIFLIIKNYSRYFIQIASLLQKHPPLRFMLLAAAFLFVGITCDLKLAHPHFVTFIEELSEMNAALTLFVGVISIQNLPSVEKYVSEIGNSKAIYTNNLFQFALFFILFGGLINTVLLHSYSSRLQHKSEAYLKETIPVLLTSWDARFFIKQLHPKLRHTRASHHQIQILFDTLQKQLGPLKKFTIQKSEILQEQRVYFLKNENFKAFEHSTHIVFDKYPVSAEIGTIELKGKWWLLGIKMKLPNNKRLHIGFIRLFPNEI